MRIFLVFIFCISLLSCSKEDLNPGNSSANPNILLIIADDLGKDAISGYMEGSIKPNTPNIDKFRIEGLQFNNLWVNPVCTPTRASVITGRYGYRTGVKGVGDEMDASENIIHKYLKEETQSAYATAIVGKWHLSGNNDAKTPESFGLDYYAGLLRGGVPDYYSYQLTQDGVEALTTDYVTEKLTDLAIDWINAQNKNWFLWLAYNAPHTPFHVPPSEMHSQGDLPEYENGLDALPYYLAAIEALDYQIGRLLSEISDEELENTVILFIGDNGSPNQVAQDPYSNSKAKGSLYQGGINVPMFAYGKGVSRNGEDDNLICGTDFYSTIAELAGVGIQEIHDSKSFKSLLSSEGDHRSFQYSDKGDGIVDEWCISNGEFKLFQSSDGNVELYDLRNDPYENDDLSDSVLDAEQEAAKSILEEELARIRN